MLYSYHLFILLLIAITIDLLFNSKYFNQRRCLIYCFLFYCILVQKEVFGPIYMFAGHPTVNVLELIQPLPLYFFREWFVLLEAGAPYGPLWLAIRMTLAKSLLLMPFGAFLFYLFHLRSFSKGIGLIIVTGVLLEAAQLLTSLYGMIPYRIFRTDDILLYTAGAGIAYYLSGKLHSLFLSMMREEEAKREMREQEV
ncbi:hypothetical protein GJU40_16305 [Bacillus lacus]|uniref:VanZ-like domain-containing protein n=1 Tax=Metabacillus lacus TaxID=1983721 RepID=A0A7X2J1Q2_9BACI|nr:VanZ family protein [Metabacillus lacus]MRX73704.1 hypothetical protein [Metabacillus lacus]